MGPVRKPLPGFADRAHEMTCPTEVTCPKR
ncbi:hypothetical protein QFZ75_007770 [Streptomyces sp. V3I8]|nr:hypothetical protein [Streptomyces sp. V3I8]